MTDRMYLDHAATTAVRPEVLQAMLPFYSDNAYNASSVHSEGRAARAALDDARARVASCLGAQSKEIVFTASGSEADNLALFGIAKSRMHEGRHIVSCEAEHHAVLHALDALRDEGFDVTLLEVDDAGRVDPVRFARALGSETILASIMYVNNELGNIQQINELAGIARERGVPFHTDAVQAAAYLPLDVQKLEVDLLSIAAHKFYGPKGIGALYVRSGTPLAPIVYGGGQEHGTRAGTENVGACVGMAVALELALGERTQTSGRVGTLRDEFEREVTQRITGVRVNGARGPRAPHISNLSIAGVDSEALLMRLDLEGIAVSSGSACTSGAVEPSHVIAALNLPVEWTRGVIRISLGRATTEAQMRSLTRVLEQAVADLRALSAVPA